VPPVTEPRVAGSLTAQERIELIADPGSFEAWDETVVCSDPLGSVDTQPYSERLAVARERTGRAEAVLCGAATVDGRPCALVASEFGFLGGSIGVAAGERIARALDRARAERMPVVALTASGGTRLQEGSLALVQMAKAAGPRGGFDGQGSRTCCTSATRRPAACSPPGGRWHR
jgi:acetyl-CoA carboxylase beta subunit